jgi:hypothetical protein
MNIKKSSFLLVAIIAIFTIAVAAEKYSVTVLKFKDNSEDQGMGGVARKLNSEISGALGKMQGIAVATEVEVKGVWKEKLFKSDFLSSESGDKIEGIDEPMKGADLGIVGSVLKVNKKPAAVIKGVDMTNGEILFVERVLGEKGEDDLIAQAINKVSARVEEISKGVKPSKAAEATPAAAGAPASETKAVTVKATGRNKVERVALMMALRDAAERGIGTYVALEQVPNSREVVMQTQGSIKHKVLSQKDDGGVTVVEIEAEVQVPADLINKYPKEKGEKEIDTGKKPLVQKSDYAEIDWEKGTLTAWGDGKYPKAKGDAEKDRLMARRAGQAEAHARALEMLAGVRVNPDDRSRDVQEKKKDLAYRIKGLVEGAEVIDEKDNAGAGTYMVKIRIPLNGVKGVTVLFLDEMQIKTKEVKKAEVEEKETDGAKEEEFTGLVIDAQGTGLKPALLPEIVDEDGNKVYTAEDVDKESVQDNGMASYVIEESNDIFRNPLRIKAQAASGMMLASLETGVMSDAGLMLAAADKNKSRRERRLRQGKAPLTLKSKQATGKVKAKLVVSKADAKKIAKANKRSKMLKMARVVVIADSMIGGTEGRLNRNGVKVAMEFKGRFEHQ